MNLIYLPEALFFLGISYAIFRWIARTSREVNNAPPPITELEERILRDAALRRQAERGDVDTKQNVHTDSSVRKTYGPRGPRQ